MKFVTIAFFALAGLARCTRKGSNSPLGKRIVFPGPSFHSGSEIADKVKEPLDLTQSASSNHDIAAKQDSYNAKAHLADTASRAADTAQATFTGKRILLHSLEEQTAQAQHLFQGEIGQLKLAQIAAAEAATSAEKAAIHVSVLSVALGTAKNAAAHADEAAKETANEVASQSDMVTKAKYHLQSLEERLQAVRIEFAATQTAAERASMSAHQAHKNVEDEGMQAGGKPYMSILSQKQDDDMANKLEQVNATAFAPPTEAPRHVD